MNWKEYEEKVFNTLKLRFPGAEIHYNDNIFGHFSKVDRQVDISFRVEVLDQKLLGIIDCKHYSEKIDVKIVESFLGMVEDVSANIGIIITNKGFTPAAVNRTHVRNVSLEVLDLTSDSGLTMSIDDIINKKIKNHQLSEYEFRKRLSENSSFIDMNESSYRSRKIVFKEGFVNTEYFAIKKSIVESMRIFRDFKELNRIKIVLPVSNDLEQVKKVFISKIDRESIQRFLGIELDFLRSDIKNWRKSFLENPKYTKEDILKFGELYVSSRPYKDYSLDSKKW